MRSPAAPPDKVPEWTGSMERAPVVLSSGCAADSARWAACWGSEDQRPEHPSTRATLIARITRWDETPFFLPSHVHSFQAGVHQP